MTEGSPQTGADPAVALDGALAPLRRLVSFARARPREVRYFEVNARRWLDRARDAADAASVRPEVDALVAPLEGLDEADPDARELRIDAIYQGLTRIDALLGLPLPPRRPAPVHVDSTAGRTGDGRGEKAYNAGPRAVEARRSGEANFFGE